MDRFDFDEWSRLYRRDPAAFEARRHALLAIELSRVDPALAAPVRGALRALDDTTDGLDAVARLQRAMRTMTASVDTLSDRMTALARATRDAIDCRPH